MVLLLPRGLLLRGARLLGDAVSGAMERWESQSREWLGIRDEMIDAGRAPSAYQVTLEQRKRMLSRGDRPVTMAELEAEQ